MKRCRLKYFIFGLISGVLVTGYFFKEQKPVDKTLSANPIFHREGYSLAYDGRCKNPYWVHEHLTEEKLLSNATRKGLTFKEDPDIPKNIRSSKEDYSNSGFDRGHLCPAQNCQYSKVALSETFYLSNISPQDPKFNRGYWKKFEQHVRDLLVEHKELEVITGPLYLPYDDVDGKRYVKYQVLGKNDVAVPSHFFKIIKSQDSVWAYVLPNREIAKSAQLDSFAIPIEKLEKVSGIIFNSYNH